MEASALTHASRRGLLARKSPLLKLQGDEKLIAMARSGNAGAFEMIVDRYQGRLLGFCRQMLGSTEDAEDVLQEVFVNAYRAMLADEREINLRPWLYRIARNRCLNHLRKPSADAQESMDMVPEVEAASTAEKVHNREEFRQIIADVNKLPETQRSALLLREMDALSYEEIADAMETTVPSVKSLLVRARISLAEASQARLLTCGEVRVELSEAAEGLRKVSAPVRRHVRECEECADFRSQLRSNEKLLAALFPVPAADRLQGRRSSPSSASAAARPRAARRPAVPPPAVARRRGRRGERHRRGARRLGRRRRPRWPRRRDRRRDRHQGGRRRRHRRGPHRRRRGRAAEGTPLPGPGRPRAKEAPAHDSGRRRDARDERRRRSVDLAAAPVELGKPAIASDAVAVAPTKPKKPETTTASRRPKKRRPPEEVAAPEEAVAVEDPEAGASDAESGQRHRRRRSRSSDRGRPRPRPRRPRAAKAR